MNTIKSEPKFGDVLHISGKPVVFIRVDFDGDCEVVNRVGDVDYVDLEQIDEYAPDPIQELRERILERWKGQSLYYAYDTEASRADVTVTVGDIIGFVIENLNAEFDGE